MRQKDVVVLISHFKTPLLLAVVFRVIGSSQVHTEQADINPLTDHTFVRDLALSAY